MPTCEETAGQAFTVRSFVWLTKEEITELPVPLTPSARNYTWFPIGARHQGMISQVSFGTSKRNWEHSSGCSCGVVVQSPGSGYGTNSTSEAVNTSQGMLNHMSQRSASSLGMGTG